MAKRGSPQEVLEGGKLKGGMFRSHLQWVRDNRSEKDLERLWDELDPEVTKGLRASILATSWYPFRWLINLDGTIAKLFSESRDLSLVVELGRYSALINLSTAYKALDRDTNHEFFRNSALLHRQFQDFGTASYVRTGDASGNLVHTGYPCFSPVFCASALGYYEACLLSHNATTAKVEEIECQCYGDPSCTFALTWG